MSAKIMSVGIVLIIAVAGFYLYSNDATAPEGNITSDARGAESGMRAEENMVVVMEQRPGNSVKGMVFLAARGYLVVHEDMNGEPGTIIGSSSLLDAGESSDVTVRLSRAMRDGETLYAMLHFEKGGNSSFSAVEDTPVPSILGGPIHGTFEVSSEASLDIPVSI